MTSWWRNLVDRRDPVEVVLYGRSPCGLCDKAEALLRRECPRAVVTKVDIDRDEDLLRRFHIRVPVVEVAGQVVAEGLIQPGELRTAVRQAARRRD